jgi:hypothetical protein
MRDVRENNVATGAGVPLGFLHFAQMRLYMVPGLVKNRWLYDQHRCTRFEAGG